jgi:NADPH-dependent glutamate synthase beta subunit-like oxidoreductase
MDRPRTPFIAISSETTEANHTGSWKNIRPSYRDRVSVCAASCPTAVDIPAYMALLRAGRVDEACDLLLRENPMPAITGRVCNHPCEDECNRANFDGAVAIHSVERMLGDRIIGSPLPVPALVRHAEAIAVVGSGPAGLACAYHLTRLGYSVHVFEQHERAGGMLRLGIPEYRLPRAILDAQIERFAALGVTMRCGVRIGRDISWTALTHDFAAVFIASGAHVSKLLGLAAPLSPHMSSGLEFLRRVNAGEHPPIGRRTIVIGGGNTAIDCARTALRLGAEATIVYRRTRAEMPAIAEEIEDAEAEGVRFEFLSAPVEVRNAGASLQLICQRMQLGDADATGRRGAIPTDEPAHVFEAETILTAIGEDPELDLLPDEVIDADSLVVDEWGSSNIANFFIGGDLANQSRTVANALGDGKRAAIGIDRYLRQCRGVQFDEDLFEQLCIGGEGALSITRWRQDDPVQRVAPLNTIVPSEEINLNHFAPAPRNQERRSHRILPDAEVHLGMWPKTGLQEAARCFQCGVCNECELCLIYCGDAAIVRGANGVRFEIRLDYCKGCGVCAAECPRGAIVMTREGL